MTRKLLLSIALCLGICLPFSGLTFQTIVSKAALYAPSVTYTLTVMIDGGGSVTLNATGPYNYNDVVQLTPFANYGWSFLSWSGDLNGSANPGHVVMTSDKAVTAHFVMTNTLYLTFKTDKYLYGAQDTVNVSGTLSWEPNHISVTDALIGIEVRAPNGSPVVLRTRPTGSISGQNWIVNFTKLYSCDQNQVPKSTFLKGEYVWIYAEWKNFDQTQDRGVTMTAVIYDSSSAPVYLDFSSGHVLPNGIGSYFFRATAITGAVGNFVIYGSLFSGFPKNGGYPYCPEWQASFTITAPIVPLATTSKSASLLSSDGAYDFQFKLPSAHGYYNLSATTFYSGVIVTRNTTLYVPLIGDINHDGTVDIFDAILLSNAFNTTPGNPNWNPNADLNKDNIVDIFDALLLSSHFLESG